MSTFYLTSAPNGGGWSTPCPRIFTPPAKTPGSHFTVIDGITFIFNYTLNDGRNGSVGIATRYGLDGTGIEPRWGRIFSR